MRIAVLASGRGSNFSAIADAVLSGKIPNTEIIALMSNKPRAGAIEIAKERGIPVYVVESDSFKVNGKLDRAAYEKTLLNCLSSLKPDYLALAGYMLLLGNAFLKAFPSKILNIHPSLLPSFKGLNAIEQALQAGVKWTGCTVHIVTEKMDEGPILAQDVVGIQPDDTAETLVDRLLPVEHRTYVRALRELALKHSSRKNKVSRGRQKK